MKTENTCVNCALLECSVRLECDDNELPIEPQESEGEDANVTFQVVVPKLAEKVVAEKRVW
jgi:hypothetical protein